MEFPDVFPFIFAHSGEYLWVSTTTAGQDHAMTEIASMFLGVYAGWDFWEAFDAGFVGFIPFCKSVAATGGAYESSVSGVQTLAHLTG